MTSVLERSRLYLKGYYQVYTDGLDGSDQKTKADLAKVKISGNLKGTTDKASLSLPELLPPLPWTRQRTTGKVTFPVKTPS